MENNSASIEKCFENPASDNSLDISPQVTLSGSAVQRNPDTLGKGTESKENRGHGTFRVRIIRVKEPMGQR